MQHTFTIKNSGNVALRNLALQASGLSDVTCTLTLPSTLTVNANIVCEGVHKVSQDEVESGASQLSVMFSSDNIVPASGSAFGRVLQLEAVELTTVASLSLTFTAVSSCTAPPKARK